MIDVLAEANAIGIKVVNCRHEMNASFAASAWGYLNQKPGVMVAASGPGMTNCITPMYVATQSAMPLIVLGGSAAEGQLGLGGFQEADQVGFAKPATNGRSGSTAPSASPELIYLAMGKAQYGRRARCTSISRATSCRGPDGGGGGRADPRGAPEVAFAVSGRRSIERIAEMLASAERPLIMIGKGAAWGDAGLALTRLRTSGSRSTRLPMGRGAVPDDHASNAGAARSAAMAGATRC